MVPIRGNGVQRCVPESRVLICVQEIRCDPASVCSRRAWVSRSLQGGLPLRVSRHSHSHTLGAPDVRRSDRPAGGLRAGLLAMPGGQVRPFLASRKGPRSIAMLLTPRRGSRLLVASEHAF